MNRNVVRFCFALLVSGMCSFLSAQDESVTIDFSTDIKPVLESNCLRCHNEENAEGGYRMDSRDGAMDYIEAGDSDGSDFYQYLISDDEDELMPPPDDGGPLDDSDIKLIKTWIDEGAQWPAGISLVDPDAEAGTEDGDQTQDAGSKPESGASDDSDKPTIAFAVGLLHPATLHLPIGLLLAAGLFALLSIRGNFVMSDCAYYCLWLGTFGAIAACLTGWWFALDQYPNEYVEMDQLMAGLQNSDHKLFWHRTSALVVTAFALMLCLFAASARNRDPDDGVGWKLGAIVLAMGIGYVGHEGGELSWKESHYDEFWEVVDEYIPVLSGEEEANDAIEDAAEIGEASSEGDDTEGAGPEDVST